MADWTYFAFYVVAIPFIFTSLRHAIYEAFFQQFDAPSTKHFIQHVIALTAFGGLALWYMVPALSKIFPDLLWIFVASTVIHTSRFALDYADGYSSRIWKLPIRVAADASANVAVIGFILAILANSDMKLIPLGALLALFLFGKECFYRFVVDSKKDKNPRKVSFGGSGAPSTPWMGCYHGAINAIKSFYYIFVGVALFDMCLAAWNKDYAKIIYLPDVTNSHFSQALSFAGRNIALTLDGKADVWLLSISAIEWIVGFGVVMLWGRTIPPANTGIDRKQK